MIAFCSPPLNRFEFNCYWLVTSARVFFINFNQYIPSFQIIHANEIQQLLVFSSAE